MGPSFIHFAAPPFPYFLECNRTVYQPGDQHPNRSHIGIFDLLIVEQGCLFIGEDHNQWEVSAGHTLLLLPDHYHYSVKPCDETTSFIWIHFHTLADWSSSEGGPVYINRETHFRQFLTPPYTIRVPQFGPLLTLLNGVDKLRCYYSCLRAGVPAQFSSSNGYLKKCCG